MVAVGVCVGMGVEVLVGVGVKVPVWVGFGAGEVTDIRVVPSKDSGSWEGRTHPVIRRLVRMKSKRGCLNFRNGFVKWCNSR